MLNVWAIVQTWIVPPVLSILTTFIVLKLTFRKEKKQAVWNALKDDILAVKKNAGSVYEYLWKHYAITQVEETVRTKLNEITELSGALQEHRKLAQALTDFIHFSNIIIEKKKRHEYSSEEEKDKDDNEFTRRYRHLVNICNRLIR